MSRYKLKPTNQQFSLCKLQSMERKRKTILKYRKIGVTNGKDKE